MEKAQPFQLLSLGEVLQAAKKETFRWTPKRKAVVVEAVREGGLSESDVVRAFGGVGGRIGVLAKPVRKAWSRWLIAIEVPGFAPERRKVRARGTQTAVVPDWQSRRA